MSKIFISYRRDDSGILVGRIYDHLVSPIGPFNQDDVFKDVDSIPLGNNFKEALEESVNACKVALVIIGPDWLFIKDKQGEHRLNHPSDFVRIEIETALQRRIPVIPLYVMGASIPQKSDLPESLRELIDRQAMSIEGLDPNFRTDMARLIRSIQRTLENLPQIKVQESADLKPLDENSISESSPYERLAQWLAQQPENQIKLPFHEIENIMEDKLPPSAHQLKSWWANDSVNHSQSKSWLNAGWRTNGINLTGKVITFSRIVERQLAYIEFFNSVLESLKRYPDLKVKVSSPSGVSWHTIFAFATGGAAQATIPLAFTYNHRFRVELFIDTGNKDRNKAIYDAIWLNREALEAQLDLPLSGERLDNKRASRIALYHPDPITIVSDPQMLEQLQEWAVVNIVKFNQVIAPLLTESLHNIK